MRNLKELTAIELKGLAKEAKVSNWWTLKKAELITALEEVEETKETEETEGIEIIDGLEFAIGEEEEEDLVTLKEIIANLGVKGTKARRILRSSNIERPYKRWEWSTTKHPEIIKEVYDLLSK